MYTKKQNLVNHSDFIETVISTKINYKKLFEWSKIFFTINCPEVHISEIENDGEGTIWWFIVHNTHYRNLKFRIGENTISIDLNTGKEGIEFNYHHIRKDRREVFRKYISLHTNEMDYFTGKRNIEFVLQPKHLDLYVDFLNKKDN